MCVISKQVNFLSAGFILIKKATKKLSRQLGGSVAMIPACSTKFDLILRGFGLVY